MNNTMNSLIESIDLKKIMQVVREAARLLADREAVKHTFEKGACDYVTEVDKAVQDFIQEKLYLLYPEISFLGEEKDNSDIDMDGLVWVLDPVDGTTNLIYDYRTSAISLALICEREPVMGVVYNPYSDEMFYAEKGKGSFLNGEHIHVGDANSIGDCLIAIGTSPYHKEEADEIFDLFKKLFKEGRDIRRSGSAALDLVHVACGRLDLYLEKRLKIWDFAAGALIVREAGGDVLDYQGNDLPMEMSGNVVEGNGTVVRELVERTNRGK